MEVTELEIVDIYAFDNDDYEGLRINWSSNIGFGECTLYRPKSAAEWHADTEYMCNSSNRAFLKKLLNKLADTVKIDK